MLKTVFYPFVWVWSRANEGSTWASVSTATAVIALQLNSGAGLLAALGAAGLGVILKDKVQK